MDLSRLLSAPHVIPLQNHSLSAPLRFRFSRLGLGFKLLVIVVAATVFGVLTSSAMILTLQRQQLIDTTQAAITRLSNVVEAIPTDCLSLPAGTQLGLWSVRERTEQLRGHFVLESEPGQGTRLMLTIPQDVQPGAQDVVSEAMPREAMPREVMEEINAPCRYHLCDDVPR
jgi:hypothetical protein